MRRRRDVGEPHHERPHRSPRRADPVGRLGCAQPVGAAVVQSGRERPVPHQFDARMIRGDATRSGGQTVAADLESRPLDLADQPLERASVPVVVDRCAGSARVARGCVSSDHRRRTGPTRRSGRRSRRRDRTRRSRPGGSCRGTCPSRNGRHDTAGRPYPDRTRVPARTAVRPWGRERPCRRRTCGTSTRPCCCRPRGPRRSPVRSSKIR